MFNSLQDSFESSGLLASALLIILILSGVVLLYRLLFGSLHRYFGKNFLVSTVYAKCYYPGLSTILVFFFFVAVSVLPGITPKLVIVLQRILILLLISSVTFLLIRIISVIKVIFLHNYDIRSDENLEARKVYTQFQILERVVVALLIMFAIAVALMSFDSIRQVGVSLLASAGVLGIILGFAAQKSIATIFAGIQLAIAQPIRLDDVVIVEGEWGRIEEIMLTYVTIRLWDNRRLIVPVNYFLDKPFQNWTRISAQITGVVYLYVDYHTPLQPLRTELDRMLDGHALWDKQVKVLQVTDSTEKSMQIRVLVSADNSSKAWDLRCDVREKLIDFMQKNYPECLPKNRLEMEKKAEEGGSMAKSPEGLSSFS